MITCIICAVLCAFLFIMIWHDTALRSDYIIRFAGGTLCFLIGAVYFICIIMACFSFRCGQMF